MLSTPTPLGADLVSLFWGPRQGASWYEGKKLLRVALSRVCNMLGINRMTNRLN